MTEVDICNRALALLGHDRQITNYSSDTTTEAVRCRTFYPAARDAVLSEFAWEWAIATISLSTSSTNVPSDLVRIVDARNASGKPVGITRNGTTITAKSSCTLRYISNTKSLNSYPLHIVEAIVYSLAYRLFGPILGNPTSQDACAAQKQLLELAYERIEAAKQIELSEHAFMSGLANENALVYTDYANRALAIVGSPRLIRDIDEDPSDEAIRCRQLLPMAMKRVLSAYDWEFATKTQTYNTTSGSVPTGFLRLVSAKNASGKTINATITDGMITLSEAGTVKYVTSAVTLGSIPPYVGDAVVMALAIALSPSFANAEGKGDKSGEAVTLQYESVLSKAIQTETEQASWRATPSDADAITKTDIANRALALVGSKETIKDFDTDPSKTASIVRLIYPMALRRVLSANKWEFASTTVQATSPYSIPSNFVRLVWVKNELTSAPIEASIRDGYIYFSAVGVGVAVRYVKSDINISKAPSYFTDAVSMVLAASLFQALSTAEADQSGAKAEGFVKQADAAILSAITLEEADSVWRRSPESSTSITKTDIANRALAIVGSTATVKMYEQDSTPVASLIRQLYPMALDRVIAAYNWGFATTSSTTSSSSSYSIPTGFLRLVSVRDSAGKTVPARLENGSIVFVPTEGLSQLVTVRYISNIITISKAPTYVIDAICAALAASLAPTYLTAENDPQGTRTKIVLDRYAECLAKAIENERAESSWRGEPSDLDSLAETDIANRALALIGSDVTIVDFNTDTSKEAVKARSLYHVALDEVLSSHDWDFTSVDKTISVSSPNGIDFARIPIPDDCIRVINVTDKEGNPLKHRRDRDFIHVDPCEGNAVLRYISKDISIAEVPPKFREAVVYHLAALLSSSQKDSENRTAAFLERARVKLSDAVTNETDETAYRGEYENPFIRSRG